MLVAPDKQKYDPIAQLNRRIHYIVYHVKIEDNKYKELTFEMRQYLELIEQKQSIEEIAEELISKGIDTATEDILSDIKKLSLNLLMTKPRKTATTKVNGNSKYYFYTLFYHRKRKII